MGTRSLRDEFDNLIRSEPKGRSPAEELALIGHAILKATPLYINGFDIVPTPEQRKLARLLVRQLRKQGFDAIEPIFAVGGEANAAERQLVYRERINLLMTAGAVYRISNWDESADSLIIEDISWKLGTPYVDSVLCQIDEEHLLSDANEKIDFDWVQQNNSPEIRNNWPDRYSKP